MRPKKFHLTKENKIKINKMNTTLTDLLHTQPNISITDLNTLHYTATVILNGTIKPQPPTNKTRQDPNQRTKNKIEKIRKNIGKLTNTKNTNKLIPEIQKLIKDKNIESTLITQKMKLVALAKGLKTKIATNTRNKNNKQYLTNKRNSSPNSEHPIAN